MNIKSAFSQIGIIDFAESTRVPIGDFGEDKLDVELFSLEVAEHFIDQGPIFDDQKVRVEDAGILCPDRFGDPLLHLKDLRPGRDQGRFEPGNLSWQPPNHRSFFSAALRRRGGGERLPLEQSPEQRRLREI